MEEASVMQPYIPTPEAQLLFAHHPNDPRLAPHQFQQLQIQQQQQQQLQLQMQAQQRQQHQQQQQQMPMQVQRPQYMGWEPPTTTTSATTQYAPIQQRSNSMGSGPAMTNAYAPLGNVHPPTNSFHPNSNPNSRTQSAPVPHKVHPPPHPGSIASGSGSGSQQQQRPIAGLPSGSPAGRQSRKVTTPGSAKTKTPKTPGRKKNMPVSGIEEHGDNFWANFTERDAQTLLKGVAPSGSQSKRKREAAAASLSVPMAQASSGSDIDGDEDSRSKRSRSSASSSASGPGAQ